MTRLALSRSDLNTKDLLSKDGAERVSFGISEQVGIGAGDLLFLNLMVRLTAPASIVELGTSFGQTSIYLGICAKMRQIPFHTLDVVDIRSKTALAAWEGKFWQRDLIADGLPEEVEQLVRGKCLLFCDNGDKPREMNEFGRLVGAGSTIVVHDWRQEIGTDDIRWETFTHYREDLAVALHSHCRAFKKR